MVKGRVYDPYSRCLVGDWWFLSSRPFQVLWTSYTLLGLVYTRNTWVYYPGGSGPQRSLRKSSSIWNSTWNLLHILNPFVPELHKIRILFVYKSRVLSDRLQQGVRTPFPKGHPLRLPNLTLTGNIIIPRTWNETLLIFEHSSPPWIPTQNPSSETGTPSPT